MDPERQDIEVAIPEWLISLLVCPVDCSALNCDGHFLVCPVCERRYPIRDGIPVMIPENPESER